MFMMQLHEKENAAVACGSGIRAPQMYPPQTQFYFGRQQINQCFPPQFYPCESQLSRTQGPGQQVVLEGGGQAFQGVQHQYSIDPDHQWYLQVRAVKEIFVAY